MDNGSFDNSGIAETKILDTTFTQLGATVPGYSIYDEAGFVDISANGQVMAIGAPRFSGARTLSGHVRVFDWKDTAWVMRGTALRIGRRTCPRPIRFCIGAISRWKHIGHWGLQK